jgi:GT2 family glycosyltransferase
MGLHMKSDLTFCISTHNNLSYLKLAIDSVRKYSYYADSAFIIHAENCTDGTNEWLQENANIYDLSLIIEPNNAVVKGIGGGMNTCANIVTTKYICFLHSDMVVTKNWDKYLVDHAELNSRTWVDSFRVEPNVFNSEPARKATIVVPNDTFGEYHHNFNEHAFQQFATEFSELNMDVTMPVVQGVSGLIEKSLWDEIGGNDPQFAPASWDDLDLFYRMQLLHINYASIAQSVVYHFAARGSHFINDDLSQSSTRQQQSEQRNIVKWINKWKSMPKFNEYGMIIGLQ